MRRLLIQSDNALLRRGNMVIGFSISHRLHGWVWFFLCRSKLGNLQDRSFPHFKFKMRVIRNSLPIHRETGLVGWAAGEWLLSREPHSLQLTKSAKPCMRGVASPWQGSRRG
jgi:hypothetical protein